MRIHKVSCCSLLPEYFFSFSKNFCIMNECPLDRIYPQGFVRNSYLHPGYYPRSTDNDDDTTGQFFSISLSFCSQLFQHLLWQPLQSLFKIVETLPAPVNSDSFSVFQQSTIIFTVLDLISKRLFSFLKMAGYIRISSYNLIWISTYKL